LAVVAGKESVSSAVRAAAVRTLAAGGQLTHIPVTGPCGPVGWDRRSGKKRPGSQNGPGGRRRETSDHRIPHRYL